MVILKMYEKDPKRIRDVVDEEVDFMFDDVDEIGSSDINACVNSIIRQLGVELIEVNDTEYRFLKQMVRSSISSAAY